MQADGTITELTLMDGLTAARFACPPELIPMPGQYVLAHPGGSDPPLGWELFAARALGDGFIALPPAPRVWSVGTCLHMRGPLGHGFALPGSARRVALVAFGVSPRGLLALLDTAVHQGASVTLVCARAPDDLSLDVEVQPLEALHDACAWADYVAFDTPRESLPELRQRIQTAKASLASAQVLVRTPVPCGGMAKCGVCTVQTRSGEQLACEDGPVFDWKELG